MEIYLVKVVVDIMIYDAVNPTYLCGICSSMEEAEKMRSEIENMRPNIWYYGEIAKIDIITEKLNEKTKDFLDMKEAYFE